MTESTAEQLFTQRSASEEGAKPPNKLITDTGDMNSDKTSHSKFKKVEIISSIFSDHNAIDRKSVV